MGLCGVSCTQCVRGWHQPNNIWSRIKRPQIPLVLHQDTRGIYSSMSRRLWWKGNLTVRTVVHMSTGQSHISRLAETSTFKCVWAGVVDANKFQMHAAHQRQMDRHKIQKCCIFAIEMLQRVFQLKSHRVVHGGSTTAGHIKRTQLTNVNFGDDIEGKRRFPRRSVRWFDSMKCHRRTLVRRTWIYSGLWRDPHAKQIV